MTTSKSIMILDTNFKYFYTKLLSGNVSGEVREGNATGEESVAKTDFKLPFRGKLAARGKKEKRINVFILK